MNGRERVSVRVTDSTTTRRLNWEHV